MGLLYKSVEGGSERFTSRSWLAVSSRYLDSWQRAACTFSRTVHLSNIFNSLWLGRLESAERYPKFPFLVFLLLDWILVGMPGIVFASLSLSFLAKPNISAQLIHWDRYLEWQQTENVEIQVRDVDRIRITKVFESCPGWPSGGS